MVALPAIHVIVARLVERLVSRIPEVHEASGLVHHLEVQASVPVTNRADRTINSCILVNRLLFGKAHLHHLAPGMWRMDLDLRSLRNGAAHGLPRVLDRLGYFRSHHLGLLFFGLWHSDTRLRS